MFVDRRSAVTSAVVRWLGPAGFALALLLFLLLPVASVSCGSNDNGPAHLCYDGSQFLISSGSEPSGKLLVVAGRRVSTPGSWTSSPDERQCPCR
jgi:hypothetical protein